MTTEPIEDEPVTPELEPAGPVPKIEDKLHTVDEVAAIFRVDPQTVRIWLRERKLAGAKIGRAWLVSKQAMQEFALDKFK